ncbi:ubiquitin-conjugating enzyme E2 38 [Populus alba x Populus x berolinensis]|uniref:Ubiquitin-conjugating enzyme E2 38 n=1 Tax=Populus alba x Populus x berolinensis TaxID=444605 RepID=A0AAD6MLJ8_9ROSI|nr:ubiquitin-conjugating enzyme E2 38 [Populus alba x Populus x berolinensis]
MALSLPLPKPQQQQQQTTSTTTTDGEIQEIDIFHQFDVVSDSSDHHYLVNNIDYDNDSSSKKTKDGGGDSLTNISSGVYKKIMQEWKILEKHLPDSIYVRAHENRIDLLRAVIIGVAGTPYHDGLYFFDIAFPPDYPARPPLVYYRSFGLRINPNLYANGRVCLSLLNTWPGRKSEKWNSSESTVLQVLVSIQALVLNEKPYYNETGNGVLPGRAIWEKKSNAYSENVFLLSCKTMLFLLRRPPKNFEGFVASHFREKASVILSACNAYINGQTRVGYYRNDGSCSSGNSSTVDVSDKFKGLMGQLYPELLLGFKRNGASLGNFVEPSVQPVEMKTRSFKGKAVIQSKKSGFARTVFAKLKRVLGLKKMNKRGKSGVKKKGF